MIKNKIIIFSLIIFTCTFSVYSGGKKEAEGSEAKKNAITDDRGREVVIPESPERILCLTSAAMTAVFNLGLEPVGKIDEYKVTEKGKALPSVGKAQSVNIEAVYSLKPDLIIANSRFHGSIENELEGSGAVVFFFDPDKAGDIPFVEITDYIGTVLGMPDKGDEYVKTVFNQGKNLGKKIKEKYPELESGVMLKVGSAVTSAQSKSSFGSMLSLLGIKNIVPANLPNSSKSSFVLYDIEKIITDNPDVIFILPQGKDKEANKKLVKKFKKDAKWADLDAVKNNMVFLLPFKANPNRSTPQDMLKITASVLLKKANK